jgi:hypothetical protein
MKLPKDPFTRSCTPASFNRPVIKIIVRTPAPSHIP